MLFGCLKSGPMYVARAIVSVISGVCVRRLGLLSAATHPYAGLGSKCPLLARANVPHNGNKEPLHAHRRLPRRPEPSPDA